MKQTYHKFPFYLFLSLLAMTLLPSIHLFATEGENTVLIMGQVKTAEHGYPVIGHTVYITNDSLGLNNFQYYKELTTNSDGYYYDTITTEFYSGSFLIYTYGPQNMRLDTSVFFRFAENQNDNIFVVNFSLLKDATSNNLQASFDYANVESEGKLNYAFYDRTKCDEIIKWVWTFGDGAISLEQNPHHTYPAPGLYTVSLTVTGYMEGELEVNTTYQYLFIPEFSYYHMGGHCFAGLFPIDKGLAQIYRIEGEEVYKYDTTSIDTLGYFYFYQVAEGEYYVKVQPSKHSSSYGAMIPTYYGDEQFWEDAIVINHYKTDFEYDVHLIEGAGMPAGDGLISGTVTDETGGKNLAGEDTRGVDIYLMDKYENLLTCRYTDHNSCFEFDNIPLDTYYLVPEITGKPTTKTRITLNEDIPERDEISINIETGEVVLSDGIDLYSNSYLGSPYPNPAKERISMQIRMEDNCDAVIQVFDLNGKLMKSLTEMLPTGQYILSFETSALQNGIYLIRVNMGGTTHEQKFMVSR
ncbi:MAG: T9SS type A sorting domain-containing protein [bacterium]